MEVKNLNDLYVVPGYAKDMSLKDKMFFGSLVFDINFNFFIDEYIKNKFGLTREKNILLFLDKKKELISNDPALSFLFKPDSTDSTYSDNSTNSTKK